MASALRRHARDDQLIAQHRPSPTRRHYLLPRTASSHCRGTAKPLSTRLAVSWKFSDLRRTRATHAKNVDIFRSQAPAPARATSLAARNRHTPGGTSVARNSMTACLSRRRKITRGAGHRSAPQCASTSWSHDDDDFESAVPKVMITLTYKAACTAQVAPYS